MRLKWADELESLKSLWHAVHVYIIISIFKIGSRLFSAADCTQEMLLGESDCTSLVAGQPSIHHCSNSRKIESCKFLEGRRWPWICVSPGSGRSFFQQWCTVLLWTNPPGKNNWRIWAKKIFFKICLKASYISSEGSREKRGTEKWAQHSILLFPSKDG